MRLFFLRHGLANHPYWNRPDFERPLTDQGKEKMVRTANTITKLNLELELVLSSPLIRARQTAEILVENLDHPVSLELDERLSPGFDIDSLNEILKGYRELQSLMLVGHEPDFSEVIADVIGGGQIVVKKGSLARVDLYRTHPPQGELVWMIPPKVFAR